MSPDEAKNIGELFHIIFASRNHTRVRRAGILVKRIEARRLEHRVWANF
jgi:hypothetical protein